MNKSRGNEKGAIIIEIIAVIALLGVLGPLLFRQVLSRNEEVENINIASEVRAVKEAFSAYILTNKQALLLKTGCSRFENAALDNYLPYGMENAVDSYDLTLCVIDGTPKFIEGFIVPNEGSLPEKMGLKRSARIANIIGADGGLYRRGGATLEGVAGGWHVDLGEPGFETLNETLTNSLVDGVTALYVATTGMDTYVPEYIVEDYSSGFVTIPDDLAFRKLHAGEYFSVGSHNQNCYTKKHQTMEVGADGYTASNDEIYGVGGGAASNECDPLFWVGASGETADKSKGGMVYAKKGMMIGYRVKDDQAVSSVGIYSRDYTSTDDMTTYDSASSENNRIEVYDNTGAAKVIINGKGEIISRTERTLSADEESLTSDEVETLTIANGAITSNIKAEKSTVLAQAEDATLTESLPYKVDPAYTSVMKDIRLEARGGARLSEILPNYISKTIQSISGSADVTMPTCPNGYAPAIIVTPVSWEKIKITPSDIEDLALKTNSDETDAADGTAGNHTHAIKPLTVHASDEAEMGTAGLIIKIDSTENGYNKSDSAGASNKWKVEFFYPDDTARTDVKAIAQTFCVYDNFENDSGENKYQKEKLERR